MEKANKTIRRITAAALEDDLIVSDLIREGMRIVSAPENIPDADRGFKWLVRIIEAGTDKQGAVEYPYETLKEAKPLYEGARVFALSEGQHTSGKHPYGKSVRDLVGWISDVTENGNGLEGTLNILKSAAWLRDLIIDAFEHGKKDLVGLSHDVYGKTTAVRGGAKRVEKIVKVDSVDVVYEPIGGGKILRMAASRTNGEAEKEATMFEKLLAALKAQRPDLYATIEAKVTNGTVTEDEVIALMASGMTQADQTKLIEAPKAAATKPDDRVEQMLNESRLIAAGIILKDELKESGLPEISQAKLKKQFEGQAFEVETLRAAIKDEKEYLDKITGSGQVTGFGQARVVAEEPEKLQAALDKLFDVQVDDKFKDVAPLKSLRAAYVQMTGDEEVRGIPTREGIRLGAAYMEMMRLPAAFASTTFTYALGNTLYRRLVQEYKAVDYNEQALISFMRNAKDFRTMESIRIGYFGDLGDITPETVDYPELATVSDEEVSYALNQKGGIVTVTRKMIINDDLRTASLIPQRIGRAAKRTLAQRLWNKIIDNATYKGDSKALFHTDHGNLGAVTLTNDATGIATLTNRLVAMFNQTEPEALKKLALEAEYLWVGRELLEIAKALNSPWPIAGTVNPHAGRFGTNHERIIVNKLTTDTNDWGLIANKQDVELLEVAFLNGQQEPEMFVADNPLVGQMFVADKLQYKVRHEYECEIADYRGLDKSVA